MINSRGRREEGEEEGRRREGREKDEGGEGEVIPRFSQHSISCICYQGGHELVGL